MADLPDAWNLARQRQADWQETPSLRATSEGPSPRSNNAAAAMRRLSNPFGSILVPGAKPMPETYTGPR